MKRCSQMMERFLMKETIFSGKALEESLKSNVFEQSDIELMGMVKPSEKPGHIAFARGGCEKWVDVPTEMIEQAERLGQKRCRDHSHPQFRITLKKSDSPESRILGELLAESPISSSSTAFGMAGSNAALPGAIWGGQPPRMSPSRRQMPHMSRLRSGGGGVVGGGGLGEGDNDWGFCVWLPQCSPNPFRWSGWECWMELCCWDPDYGWDCPWL
jgi:hypothetical protein